MDLIVHTLRGESHLSCALGRFRCALGRGGLSHEKKEGDGATPTGTWPLREIFFRPDRVPAPKSGLPVKALQPQDGWCDASGDPQYNRFVTLPYPASCETLWREDGLYDLIIPLGYNDDPVVDGKGSAIFLHCARADFSPTAGCVALLRADLLQLLPHLHVRSRLTVRPED